MRFQKGAYFIGKVLWAKGYTQLFNLLKFYREATGVNLPLDVYGTGPDMGLIKAKVAEEGLAWTFKGAIDHANPATHEYRIMINPSLRFRAPLPHPLPPLSLSRRPPPL